VRGALTSLLVPPLLLVLLALLSTLLAWRRRGGLALGGAVASLLLLLLLATPFAAGMLRVSLEQRIGPALQPLPASGAIVVLSGDIAHRADGVEIGPLTLERMRAAGALHRRTGLPILVTGGVLSRRHPVAVAELMRASYAQDFGIEVRWVEGVARDTRENARLSAALLRAEGIAAAYLVSHSWHLPRALAAFAREDFAVSPVPVRLGPVPNGTLTDWLPGPRAMLESWFCLREWAGILAYRLRDG
jgi:uncharacterized SAM-binding protein YcdF (DUF218 family)